MTTRELFKRRVIELIHGLTYEEAIIREIRSGSLVRDKVYDRLYILCNNRELKKCVCVGKYSYDVFKVEVKNLEFLGLPITIGRVMKSLENNGGDFLLETCGTLRERQKSDEGRDYREICKRKLTKSDGSECTDDDQTDETIEKLYNLIK